MPTLPLKLIQDGSRLLGVLLAEWGRPCGRAGTTGTSRGLGQAWASAGPGGKRIETGKGRQGHHMPVFYRVAPCGGGRWRSGWRPGLLELMRSAEAGLRWGAVMRWGGGSLGRPSVFVEGVRSARCGGVRTEALVREGTRRAFWGYYPPYYDPANQTVCFMPQGLRKAQEPSTLVAMGRAEQDVGGEEVC